MVTISRFSDIGKIGLFVSEEEFAAARESVSEEFKEEKHLKIMAIFLCRGFFGREKATGDG